MLWGKTHPRDQGETSPNSALPGAGRAQGSLREGVAPLPPTPRTLQAASFVTPVRTVLFLVAALDRRDTSPIPTLELVPTAGPQSCQERAKREGHDQCGVGTALLAHSPAPAHIHPQQEQNQWLSLGVLRGHLAKALPVYR